MIIAPGTVDVTTYFKLVDPAAGTPETGLDVTTLDATYVRDRATATKADISLLGGVDAAHADNSAIQVDATNAPGLYRVDWPDAAFATGVGRVQLVVNGADIDPAVIEVELALWITPITGATVRAVDDADGSIPTAAEINTEIDTALSDIKLDHLVAVADADDVVDNSIIAKLAASDGDWSGYTVANDSLEALRDRGDAAWTTAVGFSVAGDLMNLANDAITSAKYDESSAFPLRADDAGVTYVARTGADGDTLETLSDEIAGVTAPTAEQVADAVWDELSTGHTGTGKAGQQLWTDIDAIKVKTDLISTHTLSIAATVRGSTISVYNYTTWSVTYSNSAIDVSGRDLNGAILSVKRSLGDADSASICQVQEGVGLLYMNGAAAADPTKATLVVNDDDNGFLLTVHEDVTGVGVNNDLVWDFKQIADGDTDETAQGAWRILGAVTRAVTT